MAGPKPVARFTNSVCFAIINQPNNHNTRTQCQRSRSESTSHPRLAFVLRIFCHDAPPCVSGGRPNEQLGQPMGAADGEMNEESRFQWFAIDLTSQC